MEWIDVKDKLPPEGKYVLARHSRGTWSDSEDQENVNCVVVKLKRGISMKERKKTNPKRSNSWKAGDEGGNNKKPYCWERFGPDTFFGQDITHWMTIPPAPNKKQGGNKMNEENKYYVPSLEEIHSGLECEIRNISKEEAWTKATLSPENIRAIFTGLFGDEDEIAVRIPYLTKKDIEELGWEPLREGFIYKYEYVLHTHNYKKDLGSIYINSIHINLEGKKEEDIFDTIFAGYIYNKSELKKLMQMLNIE